MQEFIAENPKQLNLCLRLLYAEHVNFSVWVIENPKGTIIFGVAVNVNDQRMTELEEKYRIMIS